MDELFSSQDFDQEKLQEEAKGRPLSVPPKQDEKKRESTTLSDRKKLYIVDGYGLIYRSYYGFFRNPMQDTQGNNISAVYGFFSTVLKLIREYSPDYLVVAMDGKEKTFRHIMYEPYKATRDAAPEDLHTQVPIINNILKALRIPSITMEGYEADDIIATLSEEATRHGIDTIMFTGDKDLLQLVDEHTFALRPAKKNEKFYQLMGDIEVEEMLGIKPSQVVDYLSLLGDSSDNIPGVKGIGEKGAAKLLQQFGTLDGIYEHIKLVAPGLQKKLLEGKENAHLSKRLVVLRRDLFNVETFDTDQYLVKDVDYEAAIPLFQEIGMRTILKELGRASGGDASSFIPEKPVKKASKNGSYEAVTTIKELSELLASYEKAGKPVAFDLETTSIDEMVADVIGFSFTNEAEKAYYVPLVHGGKELLPLDEVRDLLADYLGSGRLELIGQNFKYDYKVLVRWGVVPKRVVFDTMVAAWLLDSTSVFNMDYLAEKYLGHKTVHYSDIVPKGKLLSDIPLDQVIFYGAEDADVTFRLYEVFLELLKARGLLDLLNEIEMPLLLIIANMELAGIYLERSRIEPLSKEFEKRIDAIKEEIFSICGHSFNLNSPQQLQEVLFVEREIPTGAKTRSGFSTATEVLEPLQETYREVALILQYRMLNKLKSTYIDKLPLQINAETGRIHPSFSQTGTETGRLSCKDPNLQNIPVRTEEGRRIRSAFIPKKGHRFLSADYSQIELVVLAHMADDPGLKRAFEEGVDVHRSTASLIFDVPLEEVTSNQRRIAKTINFGVMYGMGTHSLAKDLKISHSEAKQFIDQYFQRYSRVQSFVETIRSRAEKDGYVRTLLGHVRTITEINSRSAVERAKAQRIAVNTVIQGTAADIMKLAMIRVSAFIKGKGLKATLLLQIHDELVFEVPEDEVEETEQVVREALEGAVKLSIPLKTSIEVGDNWGDIH
ncbi:MAG: polymerase [Spirochaeta sp.]|jgi:DNA polymerase-1|uniref:DNA polymerase I n=1 Tax=Sphaerochaeta sp. TaxID=1972642 RepID=UPI003D107803|nr:polymerase [Spirochaeta sp.]